MNLWGGLNFETIDFLTNILLHISIQGHWLADWLWLWLWLAVAVVACGCGWLWLWLWLMESLGILMELPQVGNPSPQPPTEVDSIGSAHGLPQVGGWRVGYFDFFEVSYFFQNCLIKQKYLCIYPSRATGWLTVCGCGCGWLWLWLPLAVAGCGCGCSSWNP